MRALDARAIAQLGIPGPRLMENAGPAPPHVIAREFAPIRAKRVLVLCGKGNNGGDGFVVARRLKRARRRRPRRFSSVVGAEVRGDAAVALGRWRGRVEEIVEEQRARARARSAAEPM